MLKAGYSLKYTAAAEAFTFVPDTFDELFKQRRRWLPSAMANHWDVLVSNSKQTQMKKQTDNFGNVVNLLQNRFFIIYEWLLFISTIIGPAVVLVAMESSLFLLFQTSRVLTYVAVYLPVVLFIGTCVKMPEGVQLFSAIVLSAVYGLAMLAILFGAVVNVIEFWLDSTVTYFLFGLLCLYLITIVLHLNEWREAVCGCIYYLGIPAGYVFLFIFAICNMHNLSWGTREQNTIFSNTDDHAEIEKQFRSVKHKLLENVVQYFHSLSKKKFTFLNLIFGCWIHWIQKLMDTLSTVSKELKNSKDTPTSPQSTPRTQGESKEKSKEIKEEYPDSNESKFWEWLIENEIGKHKQKKVERNVLRPMRNKMVFFFAFLNTVVVLFSSFMYYFEKQVNFHIGSVEINILSFVFLLLFVITLFIQFICMIINQHEMIVHILACYPCFKVPCSSNCTRGDNKVKPE